MGRLAIKITFHADLSVHTMHVFFSIFVSNVYHQHSELLIKTVLHQLSFAPYKPVILLDQRKVFICMSVFHEGVCKGCYRLNNNWQKCWGVVHVRKLTLNNYQTTSFDFFWINYSCYLKEFSPHNSTFFFFFKLSTLALPLVLILNGDCVRAMFSCKSCDNLAITKGSCWSGPHSFATLATSHLDKQCYPSATWGFLYHLHFALPRASPESLPSHKIKTEAHL